MALDLSMSPGLRRYAGMAGAFVGLEYGSALALAPDGCDREALIACLRAAEAGLVEAAAEARDERDERAD